MEELRSPPPPVQWGYFCHTLLYFGVKYTAQIFQGFWKEGKFNLTRLQLPFFYRSALRANSERCLFKSGKNCSVIIAILWCSECTLIDYLYNVVYYIMIFFSACYEFILQLRKQITLVPKSDFFPLEIHAVMWFINMIKAAWCLVGHWTNVFEQLFLHCSI